MLEGALDGFHEQLDEEFLDKFRRGRSERPGRRASDPAPLPDPSLTAAEVRQILDAAAAQEGLELARSMARIDLETLDEGDAVDAVAAWSRVAAWADSRRGAAAATLERGLIATYGVTGRSPSARTGSSLPHASTELAMRLGMTRHAAGSIVRTGVLLSGPLASTNEALERGEIDLKKATIIATALQNKPLTVTAEVEDLVLPRAPGRTHSQLPKDLEKALLEVDPHGATERHQAAREQRRVSHARALPDGMASFVAVMPAADAIAIDLALDGAARTARAAGDTRTTDHLRADILAGVGHDALRLGWIGPLPPDQLPLEGLSRDVATSAAPDSDPVAPALSSAPDPSPSSPDGSDAPPQGTRPPAAGGYRIGLVGGAPVQINVSVPLTTLLGGGAPGTLEGYGPIDAATARALALGGTWRRLVTEPLSGTVLDVGRKKYRPPADLARIIRARDRTCIRPGCSTRSSICELDHIVPASQGGPTSAVNNASMCTFDHRHKTLGDFRVLRNPDGTFDWTSRSGHRYRRELDGGITYLGRADVDPAHFVPEALRPPRTRDPWTPAAGTEDDYPPPPF